MSKFKSERTITLKNKLNASINVLTDIGTPIAPSRKLSGLSQKGRFNVEGYDGRKISKGFSRNNTFNFESVTQKPMKRIRLRRKLVLERGVLIPTAEDSEIINAVLKQRNENKQ